MSDPTQDDRYNYVTTSLIQPSNLVVKREVHVKSTDPSGEASSLVNKIEVSRMGDRVGREKPKATKDTKTSIRGSKVRKEEKKGKTALDIEIAEQLLYKPRTKENRLTYESLLASVSPRLGDVAHDILLSVTDEVIAILKSSTKDAEKRAELESMVGRISDDYFTSLHKLVMSITDFSLENKRVKDEEKELDVDERMIIDEDGSEQEESDNDSDSSLSQTHSNDILLAHPESQIQENENELTPSSIDTFWLRNQLDERLADSVKAAELEKEVLDALGLHSELECENRLIVLLNYSQFDLIKILMTHRSLIYYTTRWRQAQTTEERDSIERELEENDSQAELLLRMREELNGAKGTKSSKNIVFRATSPHRDQDTDLTPQLIPGQLETSQLESWNRKVLDFETMAFASGSHFMSNTKVKLPDGSLRQAKKGYEEIFVPATKPALQTAKNVSISKLDEWMRPAFDGFDSLNRIQSEVYSTAIGSPENMLVCAPTGAEFGITVKELTGDTHLTKAQIDETQVIVATPEKWDIITRKAGEKSFLSTVRLLIIDEIHLLHDSRGPVLEALVARTIRGVERTQEMVRIVGLSATLPNYLDVATFLRVNPDSGLFHFDASYRPIPLEMQYIGITEKKGIKRLMLMNEIVYDRVVERTSQNLQVLVFVHSRRETAKTAKFLQEMAFARDELSKFSREDSASHSILEKEAANVKNTDLRDLLPYGIGIHHAGLNRVDRSTIEDLFAERHISVLVSTATLAWGVNLPARTVIIKGTQIYSPEAGKWTELSPQDITQMIGRAGRPNQDTKGEGILITQADELKFYLSLLNQQLPIESQLLQQLSDQLMAEVVLGTISSLKEAAEWLAYTYLYVRMLRDPLLYGVPSADIDKCLVQHRLNLVHSAASFLDKNGLVKYDKRAGTLGVTAMGKISSHYYIKPKSMMIYNSHIKPNLTLIDIFRLFSLSSEFTLIPIRDDEKGELAKLLDNVPLPVKGSPDDPSTKINVLLQAYISRMKLTGYALNADMVYVTQSAGRIMRGLYEIFLKKEWIQTAEIALDVCKMVEKRMWSCMSPLRQFKGIPDEILKRIEKKEQLNWEHYYSMSAQQLGDLVKFPKIGKLLHKCVHQFPRLSLSAYVQPITRSSLRIDLTISTDFEWNEAVHGRSEPFWLFVTDCDGEMLLYSQGISLKAKSDLEQTFIFHVPLFEPLHPLYYIRVISDRWLACEAVLPVSFSNLILPAKLPPCTELHDMKPRPIGILENDMAIAVLQKLGISTFNAIQTQVFSTLYNTNESVFLGAAPGSGKGVCLLLSILHGIRHYGPGEKMVYLVATQSMATQKATELTELLTIFGKTVGLNSGNVTTDLKILEKSELFIATFDSFDLLSRRWKQRKGLHSIRLLLVQDIHKLSAGNGVLEVVVSRLRYMSVQLDIKLRIVATSISIANYKDLIEWLGASFEYSFNFHPSVRAIPLDIHLIPFDQPHRTNRLSAMQKAAFDGIRVHGGNGQTIIIVPDRKVARLTGLELISLSTNTEISFLQLDSSKLSEILEQIEDRHLRHCLSHGIGLLYEGMTPETREVVEDLFKIEAISILISTKDIHLELTSRLLILLETQHYDGSMRTYVEYPIPEVATFTGLANKGPSSKCLILTTSSKREFYKKFLFSPFPLESRLNLFLPEHINVEVVAKTLESKQDCVDWLTWSFFYRRLTQNPNFYNLTEISGNAINEYLSELVEAAVEELEKANCLSCENDLDLSPANLGIIASYYNIKPATIDIFVKTLNDKSKTRQLLEVISMALEFERVQVRHGEEEILKSLAAEVKYKPTRAVFNEPMAKTLLLLQCHFSRIPLPSDLIYDSELILDVAYNLILSAVDVLSSNCWLKPALMAMQLSQSLVQAMWTTDSPFFQLPSFTTELVNELEKLGVQDIPDFLNMEDKEREEVLKMGKEQMQALANACNRYPSLSFSFKLQDEEIIEGEQVSLYVTLGRDGDEDQGHVFSPFYPKPKEEFWWIVVGQTEENKLLGIKRIQLKAKCDLELKFLAPSEGVHELMVYLVCDSYVGCDQGDKLRVEVKKAILNE